MRFVKSVAAILSCLASVGLSGCGAAGGNLLPAATTRTPTRSVISQRGWQLSPNQTLMIDLSVTDVGSTVTIDATVEWTYASNDVDLYVTNTSCTIEMLSAGSCAYTAHADSATAKPEKLTFTVTTAGSHRFWIVNFGPNAESGTLEVGMTQ